MQEEDIMIFDIKANDKKPCFAISRKDFMAAMRKRILDNAA